MTINNPNMTNLERLIAAEGVQGGVIAEYDRRLKAKELSGQSLATMDNQLMAEHATRLINAGLYEEARLVSKATIMHLKFARA